MNRRLILAALLAMLLAACGTQTSESDSPDATLTPEPTTAATASPSDEPAESEDDNGGGVTGSLDDLIPDEVNGVAGTALPGMEQIFSAALQGQGLNAGDAEFAFVTYGGDADATVLTAFRIPGITDVQMETLARVMSGAGAGGDVEVESRDIGGKTVLSFSGGGAPGAVYFYVVDDIAFTVAGEDESFAEALLDELP